MNIYPHISLSSRQSDNSYECLQSMLSYLCKRFFSVYLKEIVLDDLRRYITERNDRIKEIILKIKTRKAEGSSPNGH